MQGRTDAGTPDSHAVRSAAGRVIKPGTERVRALLAARGNPQDACPVIHIGGTNGKGSTGAFLDAILRAAGYRTARFASPAMYGEEECLVVNGAAAAATVYADLIAGLRQTASAIPDAPTPFEYTTAAAFHWFAQHPLDCALIEAGMGGADDATNVVQPIATVLCPTSLDHQSWLGADIADIARNKAGLIKRGAPVVLADQPEEAARVYRESAAAAIAPVFAAGTDFHYAVAGDALAPRLQYEGRIFQLANLALALAGRFQGMNAAVAIAAAEMVRDRFPRIDDRAIAAGLGSAVWPGRCEVVARNPLVVVDGAHNPDAVRAIAESVPECVAVLGISADKDAPAMVAALRRAAVEIVATQYAGERALPAAGLHAHCEGAMLAPHLPDAVARAVGRARALGLPVLVTGSIYTAAQARALYADRGAAPPVRFR